MNETQITHICQKGERDDCDVSQLFHIVTEGVSLFGLVVLSKLWPSVETHSQQQSNPLPQTHLQMNQWTDVDWENWFDRILVYRRAVPPTFPQPSGELTFFPTDTELRWVSRVWTKQSLSVMTSSACCNKGPQTVTEMEMALLNALYWKTAKCEPTLRWINTE